MAPTSAGQNHVVYPMGAAGPVNAATRDTHFRRRASFAKAPRKSTYRVKVASPCKYDGSLHPERPSDPTVVPTIFPENVRISLREGEAHGEADVLPISTNLA